MSLPRKYTLGEGARLLMEPTGDIASVRRDKSELSDIELPANTEIVLDGISGNALEIQAVIDPWESRYISLNVLRSADKSEYTAITFYREGGVCFANDSFGNRDSLIIIDPGLSSKAEDVEPQKPQECSFPMEKGEDLELRIFIDRSVVEVFVNGASACLTRVYPENPDSLGVSLFSRGRPAKCRKLTAWKMKRIFL